MKNTIKSLLKGVGLLDAARSIAQKYRASRRKDPLEKYRNVEHWYLNFEDVNLQYHTSDWYSKRWFFPRYDNGKIHEPLATKIFVDHIKRDDVVLDIGGHLGYFSCIAGYLAESGKVHVFEVDPKCISLIENNVHFNNLSNVSVYNFGVSDTNEVIKIPQYENPNPSLIINSNSTKKYIEVESVVIDSFLSERDIVPNFIKIDVEGAEGKVLNGMKNTLNELKVTLLVEIHVDILKNIFDTDYKDIIRLLLDSGYSIKEIEHRNESGNSEFIDMESTLEGNTMILCTKNN